MILEDDSSSEPPKKNVAALMTPWLQLYGIRAENQPNRPNISPMGTYKYYTQIEMHQTTKSVSEHGMNMCGMFWEKKRIIKLHETSSIFKT